VQHCQIQFNAGEGENSFICRALRSGLAGEAICGATIIYDDKMDAKADWQIIAIIGRNWSKEFESKNAVLSN
jgi:hypothetical protein